MLWLIPHEAPKSREGEKIQSALAYSLLRGWLDSLNCQSEIAKTAAGKPYIKGRPDLGISISHCEGLVAAAADHGAIGIDAEMVRQFNPMVAQRVCSDRELKQIRQSPDPNRTFYKIWVLKESFGKALGVGLNYRLREVDFILSDKVVSNLKGCQFMLYEKPHGYVVALCRLKNERRQRDVNRI